jgi:hypothetical protein
MKFLSTKYARFGIYTIVIRYIRRTLALQLLYMGSPCCHDLPPQDDSSQPSQGLLTSVIENGQAIRKLFQRMHDLDKEMTKMVENLDNKHFSIENPDSNFFAEYFQESGRKTTEMTQVCTGMANFFQRPHCSQHH